jgi:hypothetical protein
VQEIVILDWIFYFFGFQRVDVTLWSGHCAGDVEGGSMLVAKFESFFKIIKNSVCVHKSKVTSNQGHDVVVIALRVDLFMHSAKEFCHNTVRIESV